MFWSGLWKSRQKPAWVLKRRAQCSDFSRDRTGSWRDVRVTSFSRDRTGSWRDTLSDKTVLGSVGWSEFRWRA